MRSDVESIFDGYIHRTFLEKPEIARFLLKHERKELCIQNLCEQIQGVERSRMSLTFTPSMYKKLIEDIARFFCQQALKQAEEQNLSSLEKLKRVTEAYRLEREEKEQEELVKELQQKNIKIYT